MIRVFVQRNSRANSLAIYDQLKIHRKIGETAYLMVPEQFTHQSDINLLKSLEAQALMTIKVKSFSSLSREVLERVGGITRPLITETGKSMLLRKLLEDPGSKLELYKSSHVREGFIQKMISLIAECKANDVSPEMLRQAADQVTGNQLFSKKLQEISLLYQAYKQTMENHYVDGEDRLSLLLEKLPEAAYLKDIHFYFDAYVGMSQLEWQIIEVLHQMGIHMTFAITLDPNLVDHQGPPEAAVKDAEVFASSRQYYQKLKSLDPNGIQVTISGNHTMIPLGIHRLSKELFSYQPNSYKDPQSSLRLVQTLHVEEEVLETALALRKKVMEDNFRYRDFSVITTIPESYHPLIKRIFSDHDIPCFIDERRPFQDNPIAAFMMYCLEMVSGNMEPESVMGFIKSGFSHISEEEGLVFENYIKRRKIKGGMYYDDRYFQLDQRYYQHNPRLLILAQEELDIVQECRKKIRELFDRFYQNTRRKNTARFFSSQFYEFLSQDIFQQSMEHFQKKLWDRNKLDLIEENNQVWDRVVDILEQMVEMLGEEQFPFSRFEKILREGFAAMTIGLIPPAQDQVMVGTITRSRNVNAQVVFLLGMNDAYLPSPMEDGSLLVQEEKEWLREQQIELPSEHFRRLDQENLSLYNLLMNAQQEIIFSFSSMDESNHSLEPSSYIRQIRRIFPDLEMHTFYERKPEDFVYSPPWALAYTLGSLDDWQRYGLGEQKMVEFYYQYFQNKSKTDRQLSALDKGRRYSNHKDSLKPELAKKLYAGPSRVSISRMEGYAACPYKHFVQYGLKPKETDSYDLALSEIGSLLHGSVDAFTGYLRKHTEIINSMDEIEIKHFLKENFGNSIEKVIDESRQTSKRNQYMLRRTQKTAEKACGHILRQLRAGKFQLLFEEIGFGQDPSLPRMILRAGNQTVYLIGQIDRVDWMEGDQQKYIRVIDYKSSQKEFNVSKVYHGLEIQLLVYLAAAEDICRQRGQNVLPAGVFYLPLIDSLVPYEGDNEEEIEKKIIEKILMDGIVLKNEEVLTGMDQEMANQSTVLRFYGRGSSSQNKDNVLEEKTIQHLIDHVFMNMEQDLQEIMDGNIAVQPKKLDKYTACSQCQFHNICKFEEPLGSYQTLPSLKWPDVLEKLEGRWQD